MRILLLHNGRRPNVESVTGMPAMLAYHLDREFKHAGHNVVYGGVATAFLSLRDSADWYASRDYPKADHAICCEQKGFFLRTFRDQPGQLCHFYEAVRHAVPHGCIATMCDRNDCLGPEDVTFYQTPSPETPGSCFVGWAADAKRLCPEKHFRILIDHSYYGTAGNKDRTWEIVDQVRRWARSASFPVVIRHFVSGGIQTVNPYDVCHDMYNRDGLPWATACHEYRQAHVFWVTHAESLGYSVLEAAMAGALVVTPKGFIKPGLLQDVLHIEYEKSPPWGDIYKAAQETEAIRKHAARCDRWPELAGRIVYCANRTASRLRCFEEFDARL